MAQSVEYFEQAITIDPEYAPAWAGLSGAHVLAGYLGYVPPSEGMAEAERTSLRALALDPELSIAYTSLGWVRLFQFKWAAARTIFERALELNPNDVDALHGLGDYLTITGNARAGMAYVRRARNNDPFSPIWGQSVVGHLHMMRRFEEAIAEADNILGVYPSQSVWGARGVACWELGRYDEALDNFRRMMARQPDRLDALESGYASDGPSGAVRALADFRASTAREDGTGTLNLALWYARAGDADKTLEWLERAYELRSPDLIYIGIRPELGFLHGDKRFEAILARMKLAAL
jgi:tetratricopeptide (TPR) repeat protein